MRFREILFLSVSDQPEDAQMMKLAALNSAAAINFLGQRTAGLTDCFLHIGKEVMEKLDEFKKGVDGNGNTVPR